MITLGLHDLPFLAGDPLWSGLTSYWKMYEVIASGTRFDSVGPNNLTDVANNVSYNSGSGILGNTFAAFNPYDGTKALRTVSTPFLGNASFTISGWIDWAGTVGGVNIAKWGSGNNEYGLFDITGASPLKWRAIEAGTLATKDLNIVTTGVSGIWAYYTLGYDDDNKRLFAYVNAVSQGTTACNGINTSTNNLTIGNYSVSGTSCQSQFQDVGFWHRVLTQAEVTKLYNGGAGRLLFQ